MTLVVIPDAEEAQRWNAGPLEAEGDQALPHGQITSAATDVASLSTLDPAAQELAVTSMLDQSRQWLERAKLSTTPAQDVADFKAFISTVAEAAKQKQLSEEIQMDAVEMVRRSERALGVAIRAGQEAGEISTRATPKSRPEHERVRFGRHEVVQAVFRDSNLDLVSPSSYFSSGTDTNQTYAVTDDVSEEEFEVGLSVARDEGNLSRRNVIRRVAEVASTREDKLAEKWEQIEDFAARGFTSPQIAKTVGMTEQWLRKLARDRGVEFPADKITGSRRIDPLKVIENVVASIESNGSALDLVTYEDITPEMAAELLERLKPGIKAIRHLVNALKEIN